MTVETAGLALARRLGAGGEAEVFEVAGRPGLAYKRYRRPTPERAAKLAVMLAAPPEQSGGHVAIAWPTELVVGPGGAVEGFLMPRIDLSATVPLFQVYNPASRVRIAPAFTWRYLLRTARNIAAIVDSLHRAGYVVGDINESNLLVNRRALAVLVDCDSMQVRDPATGTVHRGGVGKPEFTAPELQGCDLAKTDRTPESDDFAVAILVFQLLMEGVHPFAGVWRGRGEPPDVPTRMRRAQFPYRRVGLGGVAPPPRGLAFDTLPPELRRLARRAFAAGTRRPSARPTAGEWAAALEAADGRLRTCGRSPHHVFGDHRRRCPWCERIDGGLPDPFPGPSGRSSLTPTPPSAAIRARRAAASGARRLFEGAWRRARPHLLGPLAEAVAVTVAGALLPLVVPLAVTVGWPLRAAAAGARGERVRVARTQLVASIRHLRHVGPQAMVAALLVLSALHRGTPPVEPFVATATALVSLLQHLHHASPRSSGGNNRGGARLLPPERGWWPAVIAWAMAVAGLAGLAAGGPSWWPWPAP